MTKKGFWLMVMTGLLLQVGLLTAAPPAAADTIYTADIKGYLYSYDTLTGTYSGMGQMYRDGGGGTAEALDYVSSMDFDSSGTLQVMRNRRVSFGSSALYYLDSPYQVDLSQVGGVQVNATQASASPNLNSFRGYGYDGALTLDGQDRRMMMGFTTPDNLKTFQPGDASAAEYNRVDTSFKQFLGLEWYEDGSEEGTIFGLLRDDDGSIVLAQLMMDQATQSFIYTLTGDVVPFSSGIYNHGDLTIIGHTLYASIGKYDSSTLYSLDLVNGGGFKFVADLSAQITSLAGWSGLTADVDPNAVPEPGSMLLLGSATALMAAWRRRRQRAEDAEE